MCLIFRLNLISWRLILNNNNNQAFVPLSEMVLVGYMNPPMSLNSIPYYILNYI